MLAVLARAVSILAAHRGSGRPATVARLGDVVPTDAPRRLPAPLRTSASGRSYRSHLASVAYCRTGAHASPTCAISSPRSAVTGTPVTGRGRRTCGEPPTSWPARAADHYGAVVVGGGAAVVGAGVVGAGVVGAGVVGAGVVGAGVVGVVGRWRGRRGGRRWWPARSSWSARSVSWSSPARSSVLVDVAGSVVVVVSSAVRSSSSGSSSSRSSSSSGRVGTQCLEQSTLSVLGERAGTSHRRTSPSPGERERCDPTAVADVEIRRTLRYPLMHDLRSAPIDVVDHKVRRQGSSDRS